MSNLLTTINTIELSNACNMRCLYCVNRRIKNEPRRRQGFMTDEIFDLTLSRIRELIEQGTQKEINLNGNGESTLDPQLPDRAARVVELARGRQVSFCTNGKSMTKELARELKQAGLKRVDVSTHDAYYSRRAAIMLIEAGIQCIVNGGAIAASHNWAGQLEPEYTVPVLMKIDCHPLIEGRGYVQVEGDVTPCCYDYRSLGVFGHVSDEDLTIKEVRPFSLCKTCHQRIPEALA